MVHAKIFRDFSFFFSLSGVLRGRWGGMKNEGKETIVLILYFRCMYETGPECTKWERNPQMLK